MDNHSRLVPASSAPGASSASGGAAPGGLFLGGPSLTLHSASVLENDLQETAGSRSRAKSRDALVSLYGYFADLFGEGLSVRLASHDRYKEWGPSKSFQREARYVVNSQSSKRNEEMVNKATDKFFEREGFKPVRVKLPSREPPPPSKSCHQAASGERTPWTFPLPQVILPVSENPLEKEQQTPRVVQSGGQRVIKGPRMKKKSCGRNISFMDVGAAWI